MESVLLQWSDGVTNVYPRDPWLNGLRPTGVSRIGAVPVTWGMKFMWFDRVASRPRFVYSAGSSASSSNGRAVDS